MKNRIKINKKIVFIFFIILTTNIFANDFKANVISINDGDTIKVLNNNKQIKIRLYGIDCPEKGQSFGNKAKKFTSKLIFYKQISVKQITKDQYNRLVALVYIDDICLNEILIAYGYAWVYHTYCKEPYKTQWLKYENYAKKNNLGIWSENNPIPPWEFRKKNYNTLLNHFPFLMNEKIILIIIILLILTIIVIKSIFKYKIK